MQLPAPPLNFSERVRNEKRKAEQQAKSQGDTLRQHKESHPDNPSEDENEEDVPRMGKSQLPDVQEGYQRNRSVGSF